MCKKCNPKHTNTNKRDVCMEKLCSLINETTNYETLGSCCGHGKYPMTIVVDFDGMKKDIVSNKTILRKRKFYKRDSQGYYYIPEVVEKKIPRDITNKCVVCYKKLPENHPPMQSRCNKCDKEDL